MRDAFERVGEEEELGDGLGERGEEDEVLHVHGGEIDRAGSRCGRVGENGAGRDHGVAGVERGVGHAERETEDAQREEDGLRHLLDEAGDDRRESGEDGLGGPREEEGKVGQPAQQRDARGVGGDELGELVVVQ